MSTKPHIPVPASTGAFPHPIACPWCGSYNTMHYMDAIDAVIGSVALCACLDCHYRFSVPARRAQADPDEASILTQTEELASLEDIAAARAQSQVLCPFCGSSHEYYRACMLSEQVEVRRG